MNETLYDIITKNQNSKINENFIYYKIHYKINIFLALPKLYENGE